VRKYYIWKACKRNFYEGLSLDLDFNVVTIYSLVVVIVMLLVYIAYRFREQKLTLTGLDVNDLISRVKESEQLLQAVKEERCWNCGSTEKEEVIGNLYEDNEIKFTCKQCGTETIWRRGKKEWKMMTGTKSFLYKLEEKVKDQKSRR
jgi:predicted RNA-binding Zn-ribbon protein involved in translation (DUF1610 family)